MVLFTAGVEDYAAPIANQLQAQYDCFAGRLYRPATVACPLCAPRPSVPPAACCIATRHKDPLFGQARYNAQDTGHDCQLPE